MLSDFDLAKQSNDPGSMPVMIQSETNGVRRGLVHGRMY
jgi:hypothetical protein